MQLKIHLVHLPLTLGLNQPVGLSHLFVFTFFCIDINCLLVRPGRLLVRNAFLKLELDERENLKGDGGVDKWLPTVDALVPPSG